MRVLISGITGFVGTHLAPCLEAAGHEVWGFASGIPATSVAARVEEVDLLDAAGLAELVGRVRPEAVVHLGGLSHVGQSFGRPEAYRQVNVEGTRNLLRAMNGSRARMIFASSAEVYGPVPAAEQPISEDRPLDPRSPYGQTKADAEALVLAAGAVVVRSFNTIGAGQSLDFALPSFASQLAAIAAHQREPVLEVGNLSPRRDFVHVSDAAAAYGVLLTKGAAGTVYNLASGEAWSIEAVLARLLAISDVEAKIVVDENRQRKEDPPLLQGDSSRLRALGWAPRCSVDDALRDLWQAAAGAYRREGEHP